MKRILFLIAFILSFAAIAEAQPPAQQVSQLGSAYISSDRLNQGGAMCQSLDGLVANDHTFLYHVHGDPSAILVTITGSTGGAQSTITTKTNTAGDQYHFSGVYNLVCLVATTITGANGYIDASYQGVNASAAASGSVTVTGAVTVTQPTGTDLHVVVDSGGGGVTYTQDAALTVATTAMTMAGGRASAAAPTGVSADNDAVIPWYLRSGAQAEQPTFGGALAVAGNGVSGTGVQRVTIASDSTGTVALNASSAVIGHVIVDSGGGGGSTGQGDAIAGVTGGLSMVSTTAAAPTYVTATVNPLNGDTAGNLRVTNTTALPAGTNGIGKLTANSGVDIGDVNVPALELAQNSTTSGQVGALLMAATTTAAPSYTTAKTNPLSTDTSGNLRVAGPADVANTTPPAYANADPVTAFEYALNGQLIVFPYQNPAYFVNGTSTAITDTTSTAVIASAGGSLRNYITHCSISNTDADTDTLVKILDGSTVIAEQIAVHGGGAEMSFPTPLRGTAATAINAQPVTTGASIIVSCSGFKGL